MKHFIQLLSLTIVSALSFLSCSSADDEPSQSSIYYIKYEVSASRFYSIVSGGITANTDSGLFTKTFNKVRNGFSWSGTYGPVHRDFMPTVSCNASACKITARILVSKDGGPFVIKAESVKDNSLSLSYEIDF